MQTLSLQDPLFATYAIAATLMILKAVGMSWLTVYRMMRENASTTRNPSAVGRATSRRQLLVPRSSAA